MQNKNNPGRGRLGVRRPGIALAGATPATIAVLPELRTLEQHTAANAFDRDTPTELTVLDAADHGPAGGSDLGARRRFAPYTISVQAPINCG